MDHDQFPDWLRSRLLKAFGPCDWGTSGWTLFEYSVRQPMDSLWIDHEGTAMVNGQEAFVSEPYLPVDYDFSQVHELAAKLGCLLIIDENSHHLPGKTIRLAFVPIERVPQGEEIKLIMGETNASE